MLNTIKKKIHIIHNIYIKHKYFIKKESYSMDGEDLFLNNYFKDKTNGFYVDVGCYHPIHRNNTYLLYKKGWHGVNIDIQKFSIDLFNHLRPKDLNYNFAVSNKNEIVEMFYQKKLSQLSTIEEKQSLKVFQGDIKKLKILDVGCGGGIICEPLARLGAKVTGIDFAPNNISAAKIHSKKNKLKINYLCSSPEKLKIQKKFDVILNMEIVEHVEDINFFINSCSKLLRKNGLMIVATLNKTLKSYLFAIIGAEYVLRWLPIGTHDWEKFVKPEDLKKILNKNNLKLEKLDGMNFNIISDQWSVSSDTSINYIVKSIKL